MAQTGNDYLKQLLKVTKDINRKIEKPDVSLPSKKSDKESQSIQSPSKKTSSSSKRADTGTGVMPLVSTTQTNKKEKKKEGSSVGSYSASLSTDSKKKEKTGLGGLGFLSLFKILSSILKKQLASPTVQTENPKNFVKHTKVTNALLTDILSVIEKPFIEQNRREQVTIDNSVLITNTQTIVTLLTDILENISKPPPVNNKQETSTKISNTFSKFKDTITPPKIFKSREKPVIVKETIAPSSKLLSKKKPTIFKSRENPIISKEPRESLLDNTDSIIKLSKVKVNVKNILGVKSLINSLTKLNKIKANKNTAAFVTGLGSSLSILSSSKFKLKNVKLVNTAIAMLFGTFKKAGENQKIIKKGINVYDKMIKSLTTGLPTISKYSKGFSNLIKSLGIAILVLTGSIIAGSKLLGTNPLGMIGVISTVILGLVGMVYLLGKTSKHTKEGITTARNMGIALGFLGLGLITFVGSLALVGTIVGVTGAKGMMIGVAASIAVIAGMATVFSLLGGKFAKPVAKGALVAGVMGAGLAVFGLGLYGFAMSISGISKMAGDADTTNAEDGPFKQMMNAMGPGLGMMGMVIVSAGLMFAAIGTFWKPILIGAGVVVGIGASLAIFAYTVDILLETAGKLTKLSTGSAVDSEGNEKGKFGQFMANVGPGLGMIGGVLVSSALLFAGLGLIGIAIVPGIAVALGISVALVQIAKSVDTMMDIMDEGGYSSKDISTTVETLTGGVLTGFIEGIGGALSGGKGTTISGLKESLKNIGIITVGINLIKGVSKSLSMFAVSLTAFADLGNMRAIEGYDKEGKPIFGRTVNIEGVGATVTNTIGTFLKSLIDNTENLQKGQARKLRKMGRALTGRRGILKGIIDFADVLKTYAQFGKDGNIGYMKPNADPNADPVFDTVSISNVVTNITSSFMMFVNEMVNQFEGFSFGGKQKTEMDRISHALVGNGKRKKGILEPIIKFADVLLLYSKFGKDNKIPILNADGTLSKEPPISVSDIAGNIADSLFAFVSALDSKFIGSSGKKTKQVEKNLKKFHTLIHMMSDIAEVTDKLSKTSDSITKLAGSITDLSVSLINLDLEKLKLIANSNPSASTSLIDKTSSFLGKVSNVFKKKETNNESKVDIATTPSKLGDSLVEKSTDVKSITSHNTQAQTQEDINRTNFEKQSEKLKKQQQQSDIVTSSPNKSNAKLISSINENTMQLKKLLTKLDNSMDNNMLAENIGTQVGQAFKSGQFTFDFRTNTSGVLEME